jgi:hypothetical protein
MKCGVVSLFYPKGTSSLRSRRFFRKKRSKKIVSALELLRFQGRSQRQGTLCVINE